MATTTVTTKTLIASASLLFAAVSVCSAKEWRGLVPLHSTCEDVKRILNVTKCGNSYETDEGRVYITFSKKPCADGWKVPAGTVLELFVYPKAKQLNEMDLNLANFKKEASYDSPNYVYYSNREEGITLLVTPDQKVQSLYYYAAAKDEYLRCQGNSKGQPRVALGFVKFDEYGDIGAKEERKRLEVFAIQLKAQPTKQGYIIAYGGRRSRLGEAKDRGSCAKNYLTKVETIESRRIVTIDGGYREEAATDLYIRLELGSLPSITPGLDPSEVQIVKGNWRKDARSLCRLIGPKVRQKPK